MTIEQMKEIIDKRGYSMAVLSAYSGVPQGTLTKIFNGTTKKPRPSALTAIERVLQADETEAKGKAALYQEQGSLQYETKKNSTCLRDAANDSTAEEIPYYEDGKDNHTIEEYFALPDDVRKELINGRFYDMCTPTYVHQALAGEVYASLLSQIRARKGKCRPFISPIAVQLDQDNKTVLEPDVIIVCNKDLILRRTYFGAPDFVLEVLSPSTKKKDMGLKLQKYLDAGVREYVMIDPKRRQLLAYQFENDINCILQPLEGMYGLAIYNGEITLDLDLLRQDIEELETDQEYLPGWAH